MVADLFPTCNGAFDMANLVVSQSSNVTGRLESICRALEEVKTIDDAKLIRDQAQVIRDLMQQQGFALEAINHAAELKLRAERKLGEFLKEMPKHNGDPRLHDATRLSDLGIEKTQSHRWQRIADIPEPEFERHISESIDNKEELTTTSVLRLAKGLDKEKEKEERKNLAIAAKDIASEKIQTGDFNELLTSVPDESIDLIFTDPPYDEGAIVLYHHLAVHAARILKPGGSLIAYAGHYCLADIINGMTPHLRFWWTIALQHSGATGRLPGKWVFVGWKPLLWFVKGGRRDNEFVADFIKGDEPDKIAHEWQQGESEASYYIEHLTVEGEMVLDPMCGSGTTLIAGQKLGRRVLGIEKDIERAAVARKRLNELRDKSAVQTA